MYMDVQHTTWGVVCIYLLPIYTDNFTDYYIGGGGGAVALAHAIIGGGKRQRLPPLFLNCICIQYINPYTFLVISYFKGTYICATYNLGCGLFIFSISDNFNTNVVLHMQEIRQIG